jgi:hypothetical protein
MFLHKNLRYNFFIYENTIKSFEDILICLQEGRSVGSVIKVIFMALLQIKRFHVVSIELFMMTNHLKVETRQCKRLDLYGCKENFHHITLFELSMEYEFDVYNRDYKHP